MPTTLASLNGSWVPSFAGWMLLDPVPVRAPGETDAAFERRVNELPPFMGGYRFIEPTSANQDPKYELREGYFPVAFLTCFKFDGVGNLVGRSRTNRGGTGPADASGVKRIIVVNELTGTYSITPAPQLGIVEGTIQTTHTNTGNFSVTNKYAFIAKGPDELEWLWAGGSYIEPGAAGPVSVPNPFRPLVTHGTLTRVTY